jgi:hypothetical protein
MRIFQLSLIPSLSPILSPIPSITRGSKHGGQDTVNLSRVGRIQAREHLEPGSDDSDNA